MHKNIILRSVSCATLLLACLVMLTPGAHAVVITQIDPYGANPRKIADISGNPGDSITLAANEVIDIVILGDGYLNGEDGLFISDGATTGADGWYDRVFGNGGSEPGIRPFNMFPQVFRVRACFEESTDRVDGPNSVDRDSYYRVKLDTLGKVASDSWWGDGTDQANIDFRNRLFAAIDSLPAPKNLTLYPTNLDNSTNGEQTVGVMANRYRNLYVVLLAVSDNGCPSGRSFPVVSMDSSRSVKIGVGCGTVHEFGHTFAYLRDEYIKDRGDAAPATWVDPAIGSRSIFNLSNISYANDRCDMLWPHLAPGSEYNPKIRSMIGNLWVGSSKGEFGQWHSEYKCQINGGVGNYLCNTNVADSAWLRDDYHYCFWCEELVTMRILERTGEFDRLVGGVGDINAKGVQWYDAWDATLRDDFFTLFRYDSLIDLKNRCYGLYLSSNSCNDCEDACDNNPEPNCLPGCDIREIGNAIYTDVTGFPVNPGTKERPVQTLTQGITLAQILCVETPIVVVRRGVQSGAITITTPTYIITDECTSVVLGD